MIKAIPFNADMALAILDGDKKQTRRVVTPQPKFSHSVKGVNYYRWVQNQGHDACAMTPFIRMNAPIKTGDILWIREPGKVIDAKDYAEDGMDLVVEYLADGKVAGIEVPSRMSEAWELKYKDRWPVPDWVANHQGIPNGIFKEAARLFIKITNVRVERLNDIRPEDVYEEGFAGSSEDLHPWDLYAEAEQAFIDTWDSIYSAKELGWEDNPWVWVYEFELTDKPANWPGN